MTNPEQFQAALTDAYTDLFAHDPEYSYSAARSTPASLAARMTTSLAAGAANKDGQGIVRACRAVGIKHTYLAIRKFLNS